MSNEEAQQQLEQWINEDRMAYEERDRYKKALEDIKQLGIDSLDITKSYQMTAIDVVSIVYNALGPEKRSSQEEERSQGDE